MTAPEMTSREELLKLAALDVFGLLDEYESEIFNRSFHHAPAAVQDEIIALQAELASDTSLLPDEQPDPSLRERVLERVMQAVEDEAVKLAPIAQIGRGKRSPGDDAMIVNQRSLQRAAWVWRAASFVLAASLLITLFLLVGVLQESREFAELVYSNEQQQKLREYLGDDIDDYIGNPNVVSVALPLHAEDYRGMVDIHLNERQSSALVITRGLPKGEYKLRIRIDDEQPPIVVRSFESNDFYSHFRVDDLDSHGVKTVASCTWEIVDEQDNVVFSTSLA